MSSIDVDANRRERFMARSNPVVAPFGGFSSSPKLQGTLVAVTAMLALPIALAASAFPSALMLPAFGIMALILAALVSALAWWLAAERKPDHISLWDVAGAFALIGFAAVLLSQPEDVLPLLGHPVTPL
jgi:hypothetical protein